MRIERFEEIEAWQLARELTRKVYDLTKKSEFARDFGLKGQIQDAPALPFVVLSITWYHMSRVNKIKTALNFAPLCKITLNPEPLNPEPTTFEPLRKEKESWKKGPLVIYPMNYI